MTESIFIYAAIVVAALVTYSLRFAGLALMKNVRSDSPLFIYAGYITYALMSALVIKLIVTPANQLDDLPLIWRLSVTSICVILYLIHKKHLLFYLLLSVATLSLFSFPY